MHVNHFLLLRMTLKYPSLSSERLSEKIFHESGVMVHPRTILRFWRLLGATRRLRREYLARFKEEDFLALPQRILQAKKEHPKWGHRRVSSYLSKQKGSPPVSPLLVKKILAPSARGRHTKLSDKTLSLIFTLTTENPHCSAKDVVEAVKERLGVELTQRRVKQAWRRLGLETVERRLRVLEWMGVGELVDILGMELEHETLLSISQLNELSTRLRSLRT